MTILGAQEPVHPMLQFAWSLSESTDLHAQTKVRLIITGRVWEVDSSRSANDSEREVYFSLMSRAKVNGATKRDFRPTVTDATTVLGRHQRYVETAFVVITSIAVRSTCTPGFVNYVTDHTAWTTTNNAIKATWAVTTGDWQGLRRDIHQPVITRLTDSSSRISEITRIRLTHSLLCLPNDESEQSQFAEHAFRLFHSGNDDYNCEVLLNLAKLKKREERDEFARQLLQMRRPSGRGGDPDDDQHTQFVTQVKRFSGRSHLDPNSSEAIQTVAAAVAIPEDEREEVTNQFLRLGLTGRSLTPRLTAMRVVSDAPRAQRERVIEQILQFASPDTIIGLLGEMADHATRQLFMDQLSRLFTPRMSGQHRLQIIRFLSGLSPEAQQTFINQVTRLSPLVAYQTDGWGVIKSVVRVRQEDRENFVIFVLRNEADEFRQINALSRVPAREWETTWTEIRPHHNQTTHERAYQNSVRESVGRLEQRYSGKRRETLDTMAVFFESKVDDLVAKGLLNETEREIARYFLRRGRARREDPAGMERYLNLAWRALHDKNVHRERGIRTERDRDDRIASHTRDAIVKSQLGYRMDNLGTDYPGGRFDTYEQLLEGIRRNRRLIKGGAYCARGTLNAFIEALRDYHPDVILVIDQAARQRMARMARNKFLQDGLAAFLQKSYRETSDLFDDEAALKKATQTHLCTLVEVEKGQSYSEFVRVDAVYEITQYLELCFEEALEDAKPTKPIHDYLRGTAGTGLAHDLSEWAAGQGHLPISGIEQAFEAQADDLVAGKLALLTETPSASDTRKIRTGAVAIAREVAVRHKHKEWRKIAENVMDRVPTANRIRIVRQAFVDLMIAELTKGQGETDDKSFAKLRQEIDGILDPDDEVGRKLQEQLDAKVTD
jgi:hypothetical protein